MSTASAKCDFDPSRGSRPAASSSILASALPRARIPSWIHSMAGRIRCSAPRQKVHCGKRESRYKPTPRCPPGCFCVGIGGLYSQHHRTTSAHLRDFLLLSRPWHNFPPAPLSEEAVHRSAGDTPDTAEAGRGDALGESPKRALFGLGNHQTAFLAHRTCTLAQEPSTGLQDLQRAVPRAQ